MLKRSELKSVIKKTPLTDLTNRRTEKEKIQGGRDDDVYLASIRSELSALTNQIDKILTKTLDHNMKSNTANEKLESLSKLLSCMNSTLKPWILRLNEAAETTTPAIKINTSRREEPNHSMIISSSPLVAWCDSGDGSVNERQLFLLTPLSKSHEKHSGCPRSSVTIMNQVNFVEIVEEFNGPNARIIEERNKLCNTKINKFVISPQGFKLSSKACKDVFVGPPTLCNSTSVQRDAHDKDTLEWFLSPPKTCTLMVPQYASKGPSIVKGSVSFMPVQESNKQEWKRDLHEPLEWFLSPPKTCKVMEPLEGKMPSTPSVLPETGLSKNRYAGESTLKKELWTKFQSVTVARPSYQGSASQKVGKKGFMDMLEEASF